MSIIISPPPGQYHEPTLVNISEDTYVGTVYFTTDGSTPTDLSEVLPAAISIDKTSTITVLKDIDLGNAVNAASALFTIDPVITQILITRGALADLPVQGDGSLVPVDQNLLYAADDAGNIQGVSDVYIGPHQPLAGVRVWHDTNTMTIKYNNGTEWVAQKTDTRDTDFGTW